LRRIAFALFLVAPVVAFYAGWPAWTGHRIRQALETGDSALLADKVDFASVRTSLKPVVRIEVDKAVEIARRDGGILGAILAGQLRGEQADRLIDAVLASAVTAPNVIRAVREGKTLRETIDRILIEQLGGAAGRGSGDARSIPAGLGGLLGRTGGPQSGGVRGDAPPATSGAPAETAPQAPPSLSGRKRLGLANLKSISMDGPVAFSVGVARDPALAEPDVVVQLAFRDGDWKVVGLIPRLPAR
jgi:hypothetical protein